MKPLVTHQELWFASGFSHVKIYITSFANEAHSVSGKVPLLSVDFVSNIMLAYYIKNPTK